MPSPSKANNAGSDALEIARLASLSKLDYERERAAAAERLECRTAILDQLVEVARGKGSGGHKGQGRPLIFQEPEPWPTPVDGASLVDEMFTVIRDHIVLTPAAARAVALWILHTCTPIASPRQ